MRDRRRIALILIVMTVLVLVGGGAYGIVVAAEGSQHAQRSADEGESH
jgi:flagellar basal body-associated protein FliL